MIVQTYSGQVTGKQCREIAEFIQSVGDAETYRNPAFIRPIEWQPQVIQDWFCIWSDQNNGGGGSFANFCSEVELDS